MLGNESALREAVSSVHLQKLHFRLIVLPSSDIQCHVTMSVLDNDSKLWEQCTLHLGPDMNVNVL